MGAYTFQISRSCSEHPPWSSPTFRHSFLCLQNGLTGMTNPLLSTGRKKKKVSSFHSSAISYIQYRNLEGNPTFALSCVSHSCHQLKLILLIWPKFPTLICRCNPTSDPTLSFTTLSVNPEAIIFWRVFSLLWACLASFALPWPNRAM